MRNGESARPQSCAYFPFILQPVLYHSNLANLTRLDLIATPISGAIPATHAPKQTKLITLPSDLPITLESNAIDLHRCLRELLASAAGIEPTLVLSNMKAVVANCRSIMQQSIAGSHQTPQYSKHRDDMANTLARLMSMAKQQATHMSASPFAQLEAAVDEFGRSMSSLLLSMTTSADRASNEQ